MSHNPDPFTLQQRSDDIGTDGNAANFLDITPGDRLPVGNQRQCFQQCPGISWWFFFPQSPDPFAVFLSDLKAKPTGNFLEFKPPALTVCCDAGQHLPHLGTSRLLTIEQADHMVDAKRRIRSQNRSLDDLFKGKLLGFTHLIVTRLAGHEP